MLKTSYSVKLYLRCDANITFDDETAAGKGTAAYNAVVGKRDVHIVDYSGKDYFIPAESICYAEITKTQTTVTVTDDTCPSDDESE